MRKVLLLGILSHVSFILMGQFNLTVPTYTQDFSSLGTSDITLAGGDLNNHSPFLNGWFFSESGTIQNNIITANDGSATTGDTYNFGTIAAADRTLGGLQSGALVPSYGFYFTNNNGNTITSLTINYTGEQWRLGTAGRLDKLDFQYSLNATSMTTGLWVNVDALDFTAPVITSPTGALNGNLASNKTAISSTIIGLIIPNGATCFIRWLDFNATGAEDGTGIDDFSLTANFTAPSTDHFRSIQTGNWDALSTWESSLDALTWVAATSIPTSDANTITIRNSHTVTINSFPTVDQVTIQSGGTLDFVNGVLIINDGTGSDIDIQSGGAFVLSSSNNPPTFMGISPTININSSGILRVSASGVTLNPGSGIHASNYLYQHQSILEYTLTSAFGTIGVTYFPNANSTTIPVFRITQNIGVFVGSSSNTIINGVFEANGNITFTNSGTKTFRNGIRGSGNIGESSSGIFIINGTTAELGGAGSLTVPTTGGLQIGNSTTVTMISDKTISGNITLLTNNSLIELGNFNLIVTGTIGITQVTSYVKTNGTGKLTLNNVGGFPGKLFPIGLTTINPLNIISTPTTSYSARIVEPITPIIYNSSQAVLRTWYISTPATSPSASISFGYTFNPPTECGPFYNNLGPVEVGVNISNVWNIHQSNLTPANFPFVPTTFIVTPTAPINYFNGTTTEFPFVVANNGAVLSVDYNITAQAQKLNNTGRISWKVFTTNNVSRFEVQRATDNAVYQTIASTTPSGQLLEYNFIDIALAKGVNLYRIKVTAQNEAILYSNTVAIINDSKGLLITSLAPNPVQNQTYLTISAAKTGLAHFSVYDIMGKLVKEFQKNIGEGATVLQLDMTDLATGTYHIMAVSAESRAVFRFSKQ
ncbi:hypothetical protein CAP36_01800 [Chitinophagaceae bacterium IBVUCB2]|nr:hypothetical protein CAP36_01800 [Chitinophagaceae bacterium IBVUCB2]